MLVPEGPSLRPWPPPSKASVPLNFEELSSLGSVEDITPTPSETVAETVSQPESFFRSLPQGVQNHLQKLGILQPTNIQTLSYGPASQGRDLLAQSHTGSGKTLAFGLGLAHRLELLKKDPTVKKGLVLGLVLTPTRELAAQVSKVLEPLLSIQGAKVLAITGGESYTFQKKSLQRGVDIVVGTPGRVSDLARQGALDLATVRLYVLDEVDQMLDIGFAENLKEIRGHISDDAQSFFFSATLSRPIRDLAKRLLKDPVEILASPTAGAQSAPIDHRYIEVLGGGEWKALIHCLLEHDPEQALIFCRTRAECSEVTEGLLKRNISAAALHGDLSQDERNKTMARFRQKSVRFLVATNVAARGLDVQGLPLVVNYNVPEDAESYTHRCGRTGRAGASGMAWTIVTPRTVRGFESIVRQTKLTMTRWEVPHAGIIFKKQLNAVIAQTVTASPAAGEALVEGAPQPRLTKAEEEASKFNKFLNKTLEKLTDEEKTAALRSLLSKQLSLLDTYDLDPWIPTRPVVRLGDDKWIDNKKPSGSLPFRARSGGSGFGSSSAATRKFARPESSGGPAGKPSPFPKSRPPARAGGEGRPATLGAGAFAKTHGKVVASRKSDKPRADSRR